MSSVRVIENGVPDRRKVAPEICQPPNALFITDPPSRQNGRS